MCCSAMVRRVHVVRADVLRLVCHGVVSRKPPHVCSTDSQRCKTKMPGSAIEPFIMAQQIPWCEPCGKERAEEIARIKARMAELKALKAKSKKKSNGGWDDDDDDEFDSDDIPAWQGEPGIIKPDITFFGQALTDDFDECLAVDREEVDLLVIIGTSLKVAPVSEVLGTSFSVSSLTHRPHSPPRPPNLHQPPASLPRQARRKRTSPSDKLTDLDLAHRRRRLDRDRPVRQARVDHPAAQPTPRRDAGPDHSRGPRQDRPRDRRLGDRTRRPVRAPPAPAPGHGQPGHVPRKLARGHANEDEQPCRLARREPRRHALPQPTSVSGRARAAPRRPRGVAGGRLQ